MAELDEASRPRVFGMTASPIDAKTDVVQAANELESLLHSRIATTMDASLADAVKKPKELALHYDALQMPFETPLLQAVRNQYGDVEVFRKAFELAKRIARELGPWCADQYIIASISEKRLRAYELKVERKFYKRHRRDDVTVLDTKQAQLRSAVDFVQTKGAEISTELESSNLSSKVRELCSYLHSAFERPSSHRCIIFVVQRHTARLLCTLFQKVGTQHMKCAFLVGGNAGEIEEDHMTNRQQVITLQKFSKGDINCLFVTSVAEEGLDVPDCNLVVRFDLFQTMIQYVQSRGRARKKDSKFIHMIERGNSIQRETVQEARYHETRMRAFCQSLPEDRRLVGNDDTLEEITSKEKNLPVYIDSESGAKLTFGNALNFLATFVSAIPDESEEPLHPIYIVSSRGSKFIGEVLLPGSAPIRSIIGKVYS